MIEVLEWLFRRFVRGLWWDHLPGDGDGPGLLVTVCGFLGRASLLGLLVGGGIGLWLGKIEMDLIRCAANGVFGLGVIALFVVVATLYIDPDRLT